LAKLFNLIVSMVERVKAPFLRRLCDHDRMI